MEEGETNSRFLLSLENTNYTNELISQPNVVDKIVKDKTKYSQCAKSVYQNIYSTKLNTKDEKYIESLKSFIQNYLMKSLSHEEKEAYDKTITEKEIPQSFKYLNNK